MVESLYVDAPQWEPWAGLVGHAVNRDGGCFMPLNQIALNVAVYCNGLRRRTDRREIELPALFHTT